MHRLQDRVALITGGASGIGRAMALLFGAEGAVVVICDRNDPAGRVVVEEIEAAGGRGRYFHCDVTSLDEVTATVGRTLAEYGQLDVLVNNAGVSIGDSILETEEVTWNRNLDVVLTGPYRF